MNGQTEGAWWARTAAADLKPFIGHGQLSAMRQACKGDEGNWFIVRMVELAAGILAMPKTYEQDGMGDAAVVHLHYFKGGADWYITERDSETDQLQAFGLADLFQDGGELGYISITELIENGAELDLHFKPCTLAQARAKQVPA